MHGLADQIGGHGRGPGRPRRELALLRRPGGAGQYPPADVKGDHPVGCGQHGEESPGRSGGHGQPCDHRARHRPHPDAADHHRGAAVELVGGKPVGGVGQRQRIERESGPAEDEQQRQRRQRAGIDPDHGHGGGHRGQGHRADNAPARHPVRDQAHRPLEGDGPQGGHGHEQGDPGGGQTFGRGVQGADAQEGPVGHSGPKAGDDPGGDDAQQPAERDGLGFGQGRGAGGRQGDRHQGQRDQSRGADEEPDAARIAADQQQLADREAAHGHHHVHAQDPAPVGGGGHVVEPGLHRHEHPGHAQAEDEPEHRPRHGVDQHQVQDGRGGGQRGQGGEHPDVAHRGELGLGHLGPQQEAQVVGGHNQAADGQAEPLLLGPHPQHRRLEAVAHHYQAHAQQQGPGRGQAGPGLDQGAADYAGAAFGGAHHRAAGHRRQRTAQLLAPTRAIRNF